MVSRFDTSGLESNLDKFMGMADKAVVAYADTSSRVLENHARINAPWVDRTGIARKSLSSWITRFPQRIRIYLGHGVWYGVYLEKAMQKKYAIVEPTITLKSQEVFNGMTRLFEKMRYRP